MKKIILMLALAAGLAANAGTVKWEFWDESATATSDYMLYLFQGSLTDGSKIDSITDSASANMYVSSALSSGKMDHTDALYASGSTPTLDPGNTSFYALIFDAATIDAANNYLVLGKFDVQVPGSGAGALQGNVTGRIPVAGGTGWHAVPEPSSGLLMLVGIGALALRRRRA